MFFGIRRDQQVAVLGSEIAEIDRLFSRQNVFRLMLTKLPSITVSLWILASFGDHVALLQLSYTDRST